VKEMGPECLKITAKTEKSAICISEVLI
jgi:hypothetical protein